MRKPKKEDYGEASSYRVINLLDVLGKCLERIMAGRLEKWGQEGMGDEQFGGRVGRSSLDGVGLLYKSWEEGGGKGLMLCMDVKGGYENVGVRKCVARLREVGVEEYMVKWVSSFLREREVRVRVGKRVGGVVKMKGGTVQGSPLSPILFMFVLGGVLEEVRKEEVEGVEMIACVDDVDFMVVGENEEEIEGRVKKMEVGLERGLKKWEVDIQKMKLEGMWMKRFGMEWRRGVRWLGEDIKMKLSLRVLGVWIQCDGGWVEHVLNRMRMAEVRWKLMLKLFGRGGRGMRVKDLMGVWRMVVKQSLMYGMELYWDGQERMRNMLQVWMNRHMRRILGGVRSTPVDVMLGELGQRRVEYELDRRVERWGIRLLRRGKGRVYGKSWKEKEERYGVYEGGWVGRMMRGIKKNKLEGEVWEVEKERMGVVGWKIKIEGSKKGAREKWEWGRKEREEECLLGMSEASGEGESIGIGGGLWEGGKLIKGWGEQGGRGLTVGEGEMYGVGRVLEMVEGCYKGERRKLVVGVDNMGVLKRLRKGRGFCGEAEQKVREIGLRLMKKGWSIWLVWVAGHVGINENEEVDEWAKEGVWEEEGGEMGNVLVWGKWEERRKKMESRRWMDYWVRNRKGEEYFGSGGGGGEIGHGGKRCESKFLLWMRSNHGMMNGMRYKEDEERCDCGGKEDRDHFLIYCKKWEAERKEVWKGWWGGWLENEGWIEMDRMLFGEDGVKRMLEFGRKVGWEKRKWGRWKGKEKEGRRGEIMKPRVEGRGGWLGERSEERRREIREAARLRMKRNREKETEEDKEKRLRKVRERNKEVKLGIVGVRKRGGKENEGKGVGGKGKGKGENVMGTGGRILRELVNLGDERKGNDDKRGQGESYSILPIASNIWEDELGLVYDD